MKSGLKHMNMKTPKQEFKYDDWINPEEMVPSPKDEESDLFIVNVETKFESYITLARFYKKAWEYYHHVFGWKRLEESENFNSKKITGWLHAPKKKRKAHVKSS
jgi:hypothetical protein